MDFPIFAAPGLALALTFASPAAGAEPPSTAPPLAGVTAAGAEPPSTAPPLAGVTTPTLYRSAFEGYRPFRDEPMVSWQETNRVLGTLGGHMGHLRGSAGMGSMAKDADNAAGMKSPDDPTSRAKPSERVPAGHARHGGSPSATRPK